MQQGTQDKELLPYANGEYHFYSVTSHLSFTTLNPTYQTLGWLVNDVGQMTKYSLSELWDTTLWEECDVTSGAIWGEQKTC